MQRRRVWTTTDDVGITPIVRVTQFEDVCNLSVDLVFPFGRAGIGPRSFMAFNADIDRVLQHLQFIRGLAQAQLGKHWRGVTHRKSSRSLGPFRGEALLAG